MSVPIWRHLRDIFVSIRYDLDDMTIYSQNWAKNKP